MRYQVSHTTTYQYDTKVSVCQNMARLTPVSNHHQHCVKSEISIDPQPKAVRRHTDSFNNHVAYFEVATPHQTLSISSVSEIEVFNQTQRDLFQDDQAWEHIREELQRSNDPQGALIKDFILESPLLPHSSAIREYAENSFKPGALFTEAAMDLTRRIYQDFEYNPEATDVSTPLEEVMRKRQGVCQDFAHVAIACVRSMGLPARYVSGYIETTPPEGREKLVGADASHAWFSVYAPQLGWLDYDPTNNMMLGEQHICLAQGRDFGDVTPLKGVVYGGGEHVLDVAVDVRRTDDQNTP